MESLFREAATKDELKEVDFNKLRDYYKHEAQKLTPELAQNLLNFLLSKCGEKTDSVVSPMLKTKAKAAVDVFYYFMKKDEAFQQCVGELSTRILRSKLKLDRHITEGPEEHTTTVLMLIQLLSSIPKFKDWKKYVKSDAHATVTAGLQRIATEHPDEMRPITVDRLASAGQYYEHDAEEVADLFDTSMENGLSTSSLPQREHRYGRNELPRPPPPSILGMLWYQLTDFMVIILIVVTIASLALQEWISAVVLGLVVIFNVLVGFIQELKAQRALAALETLQVPHAQVLRDGQQAIIPADEVVPGDVVLLDEGCQVPADMRLFEAINLQIIEAVLTGESVPIEKKVGTLKSDNVALGDMRNVAFMSTTVTRGRGKGIVTATGRLSEIGKISKELAEKTDSTTPLQRQLRVLGKILVAIAVVLVILVVVIGIIHAATEGSLDGDKAFDLVKVGISLGVSVIPEGLVAITTITMALGVARMAKRNAVVRKMPAVESLGSITTICSDKTGTLTEGKMKAEELWVSRRVYLITGPGMEPNGDVVGMDVPEKFAETPKKKKDEKKEKKGNGKKGKKGQSKAERIDKKMGEKARSEATDFEQKVAARRSIDEDAIIEKSGSSEVASERASLKSNASHNEKPDAEKRELSIEDGEKISEDTCTKDLALHLLTCSLCSTASINYEEETKSYKVTGDPTEIALVAAAEKLNFAKSRYTDKGMKFVNEAPFDSDRKCMSVVYSLSDETRKMLGFDEDVAALLLAKGAPEAILRRCKDGYVAPEEIVPIEKFMDVIDVHSRSMAMRGLRVLACAYKALSSEELDSLTKVEEIETDFTFLGLSGLIDPPRLEVKGAIQQCFDAGVKVCMITGDHPITAYAIATQLGIAQKGMEKTMLMKGSDLDTFQDADLDLLAELDPFPSVFARVSPQHKLKLVQALRLKGEVCAMTGDGVNDAPAIKQADVGIAMGKSGTDLTKDAADIILTDDNFATIAEAIKEGRHIYDNIKKFILYLISCNSSEIFVALICSIVGFPTPFTAVMILWVNLIADSPPALALGIDPPVHGIMSRKPRNPKTNIFNKKSTALVLFQSFSISCFTVLVYALAQGTEPHPSKAVCDEAFRGVEKKGIFYDEDRGDCDTLTRARTLALTTMTSIQLVHAFLCRSLTGSLFTRDTLSNKWLFAGVGLSVVLMILGIYIPGFNDSVLSQMPLPAQDWLKIIGCIMCHVTLVEGAKLVMRRHAEYKAAHATTPSIFYDEA